MEEKGQWVGGVVSVAGLGSGGDWSRFSAGNKEGQVGGVGTAVKWVLEMREELKL